MHSLNVFYEFKRLIIDPLVCLLDYYTEYFGRSLEIQ